MKIHRKYIFAFILSAIVSSTACQTLNPVNGNSNNQTTTNNQTAPTANAPVNAAPVAPPKPNLPQSQDIDLQTNHANGSVLRLTRVSFADDSISLEFAVTNGYHYDIKLAQGGMQLRDNLGNVYNLSPPVQDPDIKIAPNNNLKGKLTFLGRIAPHATSLTLTTNRQYTSSSSAYDTTPYMVIANIPVQR